MKILVVFAVHYGLIEVIALGGANDVKVHFVRVKVVFEAVNVVSLATMQALQEGVGVLLQIDFHIQHLVILFPPPRTISGQVFLLANPTLWDHGFAMKDLVVQTQTEVAQRSALEAGERVIVAFVALNPLVFLKDVLHALLGENELDPRLALELLINFLGGNLM